MASENLLNYIWETQINPQMGYSFSSLHSTGYSLVALQEMNLAHRFPRIYWDTACLSVSAGSDEGSTSNKASDYGKIASSIGRMKSQGVNVSLPDINMGGFGFTPDEKGNRIIFGLRGINGVGDEVSHAIIEHRPYASFDDFYQRLYVTKLIQRSHMLQLIKAGSFSEFDSPVEIMKQFLVKETPVRETLNGQNLSRIINLGLLDTKELSIYKEYYNFRSHISKSVHETRTKPKDRIFILKDSHTQAFFDEHFVYDNLMKNGKREQVVVGDYNGKLLISEKAFNRQYDEMMQTVTELYTSDSFISMFNRAQFWELWKQYAQGTVPSWEMESVSFYSEKHELEDVDHKRYGISNFTDISETPEIVEEYQWRGRDMKKYRLHTIIGTVIDKNKNNHTITVLTKDAVVSVKTYAGAYSHYDKQISSSKNGKKTVLERSWLTRGQTLLFNGFRRDDQFILKTYQDSPQRHTINKITEVRNDGSMGLQSERIRVKS